MTRNIGGNYVWQISGEIAFGSFHHRLLTDFKHGHSTNKYRTMLLDDHAHF